MLDHLKPKLKQMESCPDQLGRQSEDVHSQKIGQFEPPYAKVDNQVSFHGTAPGLIPERMVREQWSSEPRDCQGGLQCIADTAIHLRLLYT
ncbi:hypothetical protein FKM82_002603 [Ascaphus truei]